MSARKRGVARAVDRAVKTKRAPTRQRPTKPRREAEHDEGLAHRLPASTRPTAYRLHIAVDPEASHDYSGHVEIDVELERACSFIELHAVDLVINAATLRVGQQAPVRAAIEPRPERETIALIPSAPLPTGRVTLELSFLGTLRGDLRGLYAASSGEHKYAFTQLEAADARRFFPCFDEPAFKARFTLSVETRSTHTVISNMPVASLQSRGSGTQVVRFEATPLLSTYLIALAVGELVVSEPVDAGGVPIRLVHVPGNAHLTRYALEAARECLLRLSDYFALPYPYPKLDLVAVPDFEIGAMENAGAVFFRETLLLIDEASISLPERKRAVEVICHELAHMWYGNLVTMQWWDDLWLNEAFATWMAFDIVAKWLPQWKMWNDFGHARNSALHLDALDNTHPIYTRVRTPADATENFDLITYEKGAAVVRMLERYLGPATFQKGVRKYIKRHRESNAVAADLWRALEEAAGTRAKVLHVVRAFIDTPGFPLLRIKLERKRSGSTLLLTQERFRAHGPRRSSSTRAAGWAIPWVGRVGRVGRAAGSHKSQLVRQVLGKPKQRIALPGKPIDYVYGNAEEGGFFRPLHDPADMPALIAALPHLVVSERLGFVHHQWALVRAGYASVTSLLDLLPALANEPDADVLRALQAPCNHLIDQVADAAGPDLQPALRAYVAQTFAPALTALGYDGRAFEDDDVRLRRAELLVLVADIAEDEDACGAMQERCERYLHDPGSLDPNLVASVLSLGARGADAARLSRYVVGSTSSATPQERRRFRMALGEVRAHDLIAQVQALCLTEQVPTQDVALVLARLLGNRYARRSTWEFLKANWPAARARMPAMLVSRVIDATPALGADQRKDVAAFFAMYPVPTAARALRQADERFRLDAAFRARAIKELRKWHKARSRA